MLAPYRGRIAIVQIIETILGVCGLAAFCVIAISVGMSTSNWLWCAFVIIAYIVLCVLIIYFTKFTYNKKYRISHFLLAIFCRAENNRHYLNLGLELRPGYLGKWIELSVVNTADHPGVISYFKSRFLKPAIEMRTRLAEEIMMKN